MTQNKDLFTSFTKQSDEFIQMALYSVDPCTIATAIALSDERVRAKLSEKFEGENIYHGHRCLKYTTDWELVYVYFDFDCPPGVFCFVKPAFAVSVNLITRKVVDIVDPFITSEIDALKKNLEIQTIHANYGNVLSIKAERKDEVIEFLIYNDLGNWHRDTIGLTETSKRITNVKVDFEYKGIKVTAKLEGYVENDIEKSELCLTGKLKFKIITQEITINLDKDCDGY